jgi:hypothetical protein
MRRLSLICCLAAFAALPARAAVLVDESQLVAATPELAATLPESRTFTLSAAGSFTVTLADQGFPAPLASVALSITTGSRSVAKLTGPGTLSFDAQPGTYTVRVLGETSTAGTFSVAVAPSGGANLLSWVGTIDNDGTPPVTGNCTNGTEFNVATAGSYTLTLVDRGFPVALGGLAASIVSRATSALVALLSAPGASAPFAASPGDYCLFVIATAAAPETRGLYSVAVVSGGTTAYGATVPVGTFDDPLVLPLPSAASYQLSVTDLGFPEPLAALQVALVQGANAAVVNGSGAAALVGVAGDARLYSIATAGAQGAGSYGVSVKNGATEVYGNVVTVDDGSSSGPSGYTFDVDVPAAGTYQLKLTDFEFPRALASIQVAMTQGTTVLGASTAAGTLDVTPAAGRATIVVTAEAAAASSGLFGVTLQAGSAAPVLTTTQGVGSAFKLRAVNIPTSGSYDISLGDLQFPAAFGELALVVTRGSTLVGQIIGSGKFSFNASAGDYSLNLIGTLRPGERYGLYGLTVANTPPAPTVTISVDPGTVTSGGSVAVTWSSTNATSCNASGGWSGSRATSGTETGVGPFTSNATLTLTCTGPGGSGSSSASVTVSAPSGGGGGGAVDPRLLAGLAALALLLRRRPASMRAAQGARR